MKKLLATLLGALALAACALSLVACGGGYDVSLPIGDGSVENDSVIAEFYIDNEIRDKYILNVTFKAESEAKLSRNFTFSICDDDPRYGRSYNEYLLVRFLGSESLANGDFKVKIQLSLDKFFEETETEKTFYFVLHDDSSSMSFTNCNVSEYKYTYKNGKLNIIHD